MQHASQCTVYNFILSDKLGTLLHFANRLRTADVELLSLSTRSNEDGTATMRCIPERDSQFRDFATSAELNATEEVAVHVTGSETGGEFIRMLENIATANLNLKEIEAVSISGKTGWILWLDKEHVDTLLTQLNVS